LVGNEVPVLKNIYLFF